MKITVSVDGNDNTNPQVKIKGTDIIARVHSVDFRFGKVVAMFRAEGESRLCTYNFSEIEWIQSTPSPSMENDMTAKEFLSNLFTLDFMTSEEQETIFKGAELFVQGKVRQLSRVVQDRNFMVRLKANIDRRMTDTGVKEMMLDGSSSKKIFSDAWKTFFESLEDITLETLQGKEPNPILSRGFTEQEMETAWQSGYESGLENEPNSAHDYIASLPTSGKVSGVENLSQDGTQC